MNLFGTLKYLIALTACPVNHMPSERFQLIQKFQPYSSKRLQKPAAENKLETQIK